MITQLHGKPGAHDICTKAQVAQVFQWTSLLYMGFGYLKFTYLLIVVHFLLAGKWFSVSGSG